MTHFCEELPGVWGWDAGVPFPELIDYLTSFENNQSKNLKLAFIASNFYQYSSAYGLNDERKAVVRELYKNKLPLNNQQDLDMATKHIVVFINDEYYVEEGILKTFGDQFKLTYSNNTHKGLGRILTREELREPDFISENGEKFEAKMCWESEISKFPSEATLDYTVNPDNFEEDKFLEAFNKLSQVKALHTTPWCFCFVKKRATFGHVIGVDCRQGYGTSAVYLGPMTVKFIRANQKYI